MRQNKTEVVMKWRGALTQVNWGCQTQPVSEPELSHFPACVLSSESPDLSVPRVPHLYNDSTQLIGLLRIM